VLGTGFCELAFLFTQTLRTRVLGAGYWKLVFCHPNLGTTVLGTGCWERVGTGWSEMNVGN
jgi:hypothetical protein